ITVRRALVAPIDDQLVAGSETLADIDGVLSGQGLDTLALAADQPDRASAILVFDAEGAVVLSVPSGTGEEQDPLPDVGAVGLAELESRDGPSTVDAVDGSFSYRAVAVTIDDSVLVLATPLKDVDATMTRVSVVLLVS